MKIKDKLRGYIDSYYPIIYINEFDFHEVDKIIGDICKDKNIIEYFSGKGQLNFNNKRVIGLGNDLSQFLLNYEDEGYKKENILLLKDVHNELSRSDVIASLKKIAMRNLYDQDYSTTVLIVSNILKIPKELNDYITLVDIPKPNEEEIREIIEDFLNKQEYIAEDDLIGEFVQSFKGLSKLQIIQILNLAYQDGGNLKLEDKNLVIKEKKQIIKKEGLLEFVEVKESSRSVGGLDNLISWIKNKKKIFNNLDKAIKKGVDIPKGVIIFGMPGCGKSLTAKVTSKILDIPLIRLDIGKMMGKYIGESEENLRKSLTLTENISPCVLWIDELEKAFSGIGGIGGASDITTRLFGQFLTWLQEKDNNVFVVATANDISNLPPEFLRKGRFDEIFSVDFPKKKEIKRIFEIHLEKRKSLNKDIDIEKVVKEVDDKNYSGSDIEAIVKDAVEKAFLENRDKIKTEDIIKSIKNIKPMSKSLSKKIESIKEKIKEIDCRSASR